MTDHPPPTPSRPPTDSEEHASGDGLDRLTRYMSDIESWRVLNAAAESRASKAWAALDKYGHHLDHCAELKWHAVGPEHGPCDCGFMAALHPAALGEARGTASASESLDETQNSERGALRASLSGPHLRFDARGERVIQCWCGRHDLYSTSETVRGGGERHGFRHCYPVAAALGGRSGTAPTAPADLSESAPPAPDLLRCSTIRDDKPGSPRCGGMSEVGICAECIAEHAAVLRENMKEAARARAAHLENAELLAKAQGALREARQVIEWATEDAEHPLRASTIGKLYQALHAIDAALASSRIAGEKE